MSIHRPVLSLAAIALLAGCPWIDAEDYDDHVDQDGDGYVAHQFHGNDCDDRDPAVHPGAAEIWYDGADQDCSGGPDDDQDGDGLAAASVGGEDCDDTDPEIGVAVELHLDADGDGHGGPVTVAVCDPPPDAVASGDDCDDGDPAVHPDGTEVCGGADEDCDGLTDDADPDVAGAPTWYEDLDRDLFGQVELATACVGPQGAVLLGGDCDDQDPARSPGLVESCNGIDDNCDPLVDEEDPTIDLAQAGWYADVDGDGAGNEATRIVSCTAIPGRMQIGGDCDDQDPLISPSAPEVCDGLDDDCDGLIDDADPDVVPIAWYTDGDGDGSGAGAAVWMDCAGIAGAAPNDDDCDDADDNVHPGALETCDGVDDDCDALTDDADPGIHTGWFVDADGDGFGAAAIEICVVRPDPSWASVGGDCDDLDPSRNPGVLEVWYDDVDADCSGDADDDQDGDGVGVFSDCDDLDPVRTGVEIWYDGVDEDCDPASDFDQDRDGHDALASGGDDCDDTDPLTFPGAAELWYDGGDGNCDGGSDFDQDGDGVDGVPYGVDCDDLDVAVVDGGLVTVAFPGAYGSLQLAIDAVCDYGVIQLDPAYVDDPAFTHATITRPVTVRGAGPLFTTLADVSYDVQAPFSLESVTITDSLQTPIFALGKNGSVGLVDVDCTGNDDGCVRTSLGLSIRDSTFGDNAGTVIQAMGTLDLTVERTTFGPGDDGVVDLSNGVVARFEDVAFVDEVAADPDQPLLSFDQVDATLERVTWDGCAAVSLVESTNGGSLTVTDGLGVDNVLTESAVSVRGTAGTASVDGLTLVNTVTSLRPLVELSGFVERVDRVQILGTTGLDAAVSVTDQRDEPVVVHNLLIAGHPGVGLRLNAPADLKFVTVVGASVAILQDNADQVTVDSAVLVGNEVALDLDPTLLIDPIRTLVYQNTVDGTGSVTGYTVADPRLVTWDPSIDWSGWDLHLEPTSPGVDAGEAATLDPDGTRADLGFYGGPGAEVPWYYDDLDHDGLPDGWEARWSADLDPAEDLDGDLVDALDEHLAGTSPVDPDTDHDGGLDWLDGWPLDATRY